MSHPRRFSSNVRSARLSDRLTIRPPRLSSSAVTGKRSPRAAFKRLQTGPSWQKQVGPEIPNFNFGAFWSHTKSGWNRVTEHNSSSLTGVAEAFETFKLMASSVLQPLLPDVYSFNRSYKYIQCSQLKLEGATVKVLGSSCPCAHEPLTVMPFSLSNLLLTIQYQ